MLGSPKVKRFARNDRGICAPTVLADPEAIDWSKVELPDAWPDQLEGSALGQFRLLVRKLWGRQLERVRLPHEMLPCRVPLPDYLLREFHNLPNGNFSKAVSRGYTRGFDLAMLGRMDEARRVLASHLAGCESVLDVGCGSGGMTAELARAGIADVWGLDASPYMLQHAAADHPSLHFLQGLAEDTGFPAQRFAGISACFVFHEIPALYAERALAEFYRVLKPGGLVSLAEPGPEQWYCSRWRMLRTFGLAGFYFRFLAHRVHEPFAETWHNLDYEAWAKRHGFILLSDATSMPVRYLRLQKAT